MQNTPDVKMGLVAVSRDCFPIALSRNRLGMVVEACRKLGLGIVPAETIVETEKDALQALAEMTQKGVNAVAIYLGNFGPEGPTTIFAEKFGGPFMLCAAAEESKADLMDGRGDAFCGLLNASYNCGLRDLTPHIPPMPVGLPDRIAEMIGHFVNVARVVIGIRGFARFYRYALIEKRFPHHTALCAARAGRALFDAVKLLGVDDIQTPRPTGRLYPTENPFG